MAKKISDLTEASSLDDNDSFIFNDVSAGNDKRITASVFRREINKYSVKNFGVEGDGVTDDTAAIQSVLNSNQIVYFPESDYLVTGTLTYSVQSGKIFGEGVSSRIIHEPTSDDQGCLLVTSDNTKVENLHISNVQNGADDKGTGSAFMLSGCENSEINNCYTTSSRNTNRNAIYGTIPSVSSIDRYMVVNAFHINSSENCKINNCISNGGTYTGLRITESTKCKIINSSVLSTYRGFMLAGDESANFTTKSEISDCIFSDCDHIAGKIETGCNENIVRNNTFDNVITLEVTDGSAITNQGAFTIIDNNKFICLNADNTHPGIITVEKGIVTSSECVKVTNNYIVSDSSVTIPSVYLNEPDDGVVVENNRIDSHGGTAIFVFKCDNSSIKNNYIDVCDIGIEIDFSISLNVAFNIVKNAVNEGMRCVTGTLGNVSNLLITDNKLIGCDIGILLNRVTNFIVVNNDSRSSTDADYRINNSENGSVKFNITETSISQSGNTSVDVSDNLVAV